MLLVSGVKAMLAYDPAAHAAAEYVDVGCLGDRECTHCGALLWPGEAVRVAAGVVRRMRAPITRMAVGKETTNP